MLRHMHPKRGCDCRRSSKHEGTGSPRPIARRSRRAGGYSPVLRLTADEVSLPLFPCPQKFTFWDTTLLPRGTFFGSGPPVRSRTPQGRFPPARLLHPGGRCGMVRSYCLVNFTPNNRSFSHKQSLRDFLSFEDIHKVLFFLRRVSAFGWSAASRVICHASLVGAGIMRLCGYLHFRSLCEFGQFVRRIADGLIEVLDVHRPDAAESPVAQGGDVHPQEFCGFVLVDMLVGENVLHPWSSAVGYHGDAYCLWQTSASFGLMWRAFLRDSEFANPCDRAFP